MENPTEKIAPLLNEVFAYGIGELVVRTSLARRMTAELSVAPLLYGRVVFPEPGVIVEREALQCHGGVQLIYAVATTNAHERRVDKLFEYELQLFAELEQIVRGLAADRKASPDREPPEDD